MDAQIEPTILSETLLREFSNFLEAVPARRLSRGLRNVFIAYVREEMNIGFQLFFDDFVRDLDLLFDLLDVIEDEYKLPVIKDNS